MESYIISVTFPTSEKRYKYLIDKSAKIAVGDEMYIFSKGYDYRKSLVTVQSIQEGIEWCGAPLKDITAIFCPKKNYEWVFDYSFSEEEHNQKKCFIQECREKEGISLFCTSTKNIKNTKKDKGANTMNKIFNGLEFGKIKQKNSVKMTLKGLALYNGSDSETVDLAYCIYNPETEEVEDVTPLVMDFNASDFLYKMPVAVSDLKAGDIIFHYGEFAFVRKNENGKIEIFQPVTREIKTFVPTKNIFGFSYVTKVVNFLGDMSTTMGANEENPFGMMLPLVLMDEDSDTNDLLPLMMMMNQSSVKEANFMSNPMMILMLAKSSGSNSLLPLMMMSNMNGEDTNLMSNPLMMLALMNKENNISTDWL